MRPSSRAFIKNVGGQPGALISNGTVHVGDTFFVEITAQDLVPGNKGLGGVGLRIEWDPTVLQEIDSPFNPADPNSPLVTQSFPSWRGGTLDNADGVIDKLQGMTDAPLGPGNLIGVNGPSEFSILQFRAEAPVQESSITIQGRPGMAFVPEVDYTGDNFIFDSATITVLPQSQVATTTTTTTIGQSGPTTTSVPTSTTTTTTPTSSTTTTPTTQAAVVGLQMDLYQDDDGVPGSQITDDTVTAGSSFFVEITAQDLRATPEGIAGLSVDLAWNPRVLQEIDSPFDPVSAADSLVSTDLPLYRSGQLDNTAGTIEDLGGVSFPASNQGTSIGINGPQTFSLLQFQALATPGSSTFSLAIGSGGIGIVDGSVDPGYPLVGGGVSIQPLTVTVAPRLPPPRPRFPSLCPARTTPPSSSPRWSTTASAAARSPVPWCGRLSPIRSSSST